MLQCNGNISKSPDLSVSFPSLIRPVKAFETKLKPEFGAIHIRYFAILWCSYSDPLALGNSKSFGVYI